MSAQAKEAAEAYYLINDHGYFRRFKADYQRIDSISYFAGTIAGTKARLGA